MGRDTGFPLLSQTTAAFIARWMSAEDTLMDSPWNDSESFIENRSGERNRYLARELLSRWDGELPRPMFVFGIYAPLDGPIPPFRGWGAVQDYPGDNPDSRMNTGAPPPVTSPPGMAAQNNTGTQSSGQRSGSVSTDDSRRQDSLAYEEELRYRASSSARDRPRFRDEPVWDNRNRRPTPYSSAYEGTRSRNTSDDGRRHRAIIAGPPGPRGPLVDPPPAVRGVPDPVRTLDNPDLLLAPRGPDGHPQSEWAIRQAGADTSMEDECPPADPGYAAAEEARIERARTKPLKEGRAVQPSWREGNQRLQGRFYCAQITTLEQAFNLIAFLEAGQQEAYELYSTLTQNLAAFPLHFRMEGEAYLMRHQQDIETSWWITVTGVRRPSRGDRHPGPAQARRAQQQQQIPGPFTPNPVWGDRGGSSIGMGNSMAALARQYGPGVAFNSAGNAHAPARNFARIDDPTRPHPLVDAPRPRYGPRSVGPAPPRSITPVLSVDASQGYLGLSPPDPNDAPPARALSEFVDSALVPNTRWTAGELAERYQHQDPSMWARGILNSSGHIATVLGDTARREDILAHHTNLALAPDQRRALSHQHHQFTHAALILFSVRGLFAHIVRVGGYPVGRAPMGHYASLTDNITLFLTAAWYVSHGIAPDSSDVLALEEFARSRRNMLAGNSNVANEEWPTDDMDAVATLGFEAPRIPLWADVHHAPLRPEAVQNGAVANDGAPPADAPGTGLAGSAHAPMEDVVGGPVKADDVPEA
ncbi:hypothetical protein C8R47DRAFT_1084806 [Mycena vitilis]|nr:hypothetical protein C8R47DRAFT_1084806 [Mycena vitilis]